MAAAAGRRRYSLTHSLFNGQRIAPFLTPLFFLCIDRNTKISSPVNDQYSLKVVISKYNSDAIQVLSLLLICLPSRLIRSIALRRIK